ncbi:hypothetical protein [Roseiconus lacunae]|uniref:hypothetical protein n=1 Tax=Roseiconus lacunae TaxID=2605694 RepID=UPI0011F16851|nr:hypothetical protein [Roseiconus lacunae]
MAKRKRYILQIGYTTIAGPLTKLQAIQRACVGCCELRFEVLGVGDETEHVYVQNANDIECHVASPSRPIMTEQQFRRESIPKITSQPLGQETI